MRRPTVPMPMRALVVALALCCPGLAACTPVGAAVGAGSAATRLVVEDRPVETTARDLRIQAEINRLLVAHSVALAADVDLTVREGRVLLTGTVARPEDRIAAVRLAWEPDGVAEVLNQLELQDDSDIFDAARDRLIQTTLRSRLIRDGSVLSVNYSVDVVNGTVYLMGIAQSRAELDRVMAHARGLGHVRRIVDYVRLRQPEAGE